MRNTKPRPELVGRVVGNVAIQPRDIGGGVAGPNHQTRRDERADRVEPEHERRRHAEVAAAAVQRPEQVGVLVLAGGDLPAVGGDEIDRDQVVAGEPEPPLEPT